MEKESGEVIQGAILQRGNATSPYTVVTTDKVVEFIDSGDVTVTLISGKTPNAVTTVGAGSRYAIGKDVATIAFVGIFSVS